MEATPVEQPRRMKAPVDLERHQLTGGLEFIIERHHHPKWDTKIVRDPDSESLFPGRSIAYKLSHVPRGIQFRSPLVSDANHFVLARDWRFSPLDHLDRLQSGQCAFLTFEFDAHIKKHTHEDEYEKRYLEGKDAILAAGFPLEEYSERYERYKWLPNGTEELAFAWTRYWTDACIKGTLSKLFDIPALIDDYRMRSMLPEPLTNRIIREIRDLENRNLPSFLGRLNDVHAETLWLRDLLYGIPVEDTIARYWSSCHVPDVAPLRSAKRSAKAKMEWRAEQKQVDEALQASGSMVEVGTIIYTLTVPLRARVNDFNPAAAIACHRYMNVTKDQAAVTEKLWKLIKQAVPDGIGPLVDAIVGDEINVHFPHAGLYPGNLAQKVLKSHVESCPWAGRFGDDFGIGIFGCVKIEDGAPEMSIRNSCTEDPPFVVSEHDPSWQAFGYSAEEEDYFRRLAPLPIEYRYVVTTEVEIKAMLPATLLTPATKRAIEILRHTHAFALPISDRVGDFILGEDFASHSTDYNDHKNNGNDPRFDRLIALFLPHSSSGYRLLPAEDKDLFYSLIEKWLSREDIAQLKNIRIEQRVREDAELIATRIVTRISHRSAVERSEL